MAIILQQFLSMTKEIKSNIQPNLNGPNPGTQMSIQKEILNMLEWDLERLSLHTTQIVKDQEYRVKIIFLLSGILLQ